MISGIHELIPEFLQGLLPAILQKLILDPSGTSFETPPGVPSGIPQKVHFSEVPKEIPSGLPL